MNDDDVYTTLYLSEKDYKFFIEMCEREPNKEQVEKLKKLFRKTSPWDETLNDGLDEWEWEND